MNWKNPADKNNDGEISSEEIAEFLDKPEKIDLDNGNLENLDKFEFKAPKKDIADIAVPKDNLLKRIFRSAKKLIMGRNKAGRKIGYGLDLMGVFVPVVSKIRNASKGLLGLNKSKQNKGNDMNWIVNRLKEKSTWRGVIAVLTAVGVGLSPDQKEAIIVLGVAAIGVFEAFFKEPQSADA